MNAKAAALGAVALFCPFTSQAASVYVGGAVLGVSHPDYKNVDVSFGGKGYLGVRFAPAPIFIEASYWESGKSDVKDSDIQSLRFSGYTLGAGYILAMSPTGSGVMLRGSYYGGKTKVEGYGTSIEPNASGFGFGVAAVYKFNDWVGLRLEYEGLVGVKDTVDNGSFLAYSAGMFFEFGGASAPATSPTASPVPLSSVPASAPPPTIPVEPTAAAPSTAPGFSGVALNTDAPLRTQPRVSAQAQLILRAGTAVHASQPLSNSDGNWYYAEDAAGHAGWIPASALPR